MKILITGSTGLLGQALSRAFARSCDVVGLSRHAPVVPSAGRHVTGDLCDASRTAALLHEIQPDVVIHAQALSDVDRCEEAPALAQQMIVEATRHLTDALQGTATLLVHISTDYVFDGRKGSAYDEADAPHPISVYGRVKLDAEQVALHYPRAIVVRPSTLFGPGRMNFCEYIVTRLKRQQPVDAFVDQVTSPTYTEDMAQAVTELLLPLQQAPEPASVVPGRVLHMTNAGGCSRVACAQRIAGFLGLRKELVRPIRMAEQHRPAPRPAYSALTSRYLSRIIGRGLRPWDSALEAYLRQQGWLN